MGVITANYGFPNLEMSCLNDPFSSLVGGFLHLAVRLVGFLIWKFVCLSGCVVCLFGRVVGWFEFFFLIKFHTR